MFFVSLWSYLPKRRKLIRKGLCEVFCCCFWKHVDICQCDLWWHWGIGGVEGLRKGWMFRFRSQILARRSVIGISQVSFGGSKAVAVNLVISKSQIFSGIAKRTFFSFFFQFLECLTLQFSKTNFCALRVQLVARWTSTTWLWCGRDLPRWGLRGFYRIPTSNVQRAHSPPVIATDSVIRLAAHHKKQTGTEILRDNN